MPLTHLYFYISQPTRKTSRFHTLIDNIFSNVTDRDIVSGNLTATVSDHLSQLSIVNSTKIYTDKINMLLDTYAPLKKINKYKLIFKSKPCITLSLQRSISV